MKEGDLVVITGDEEEWGHNLAPGTRVTLVNKVRYPGKGRDKSNLVDGWCCSEGDFFRNVAARDLENLVTEQDVADAMASIQKGRLANRAYERKLIRRGLLDMGFHRTNYTKADEVNNYEETWTRSGASITLAWTEEVT